MEKKSKPVAPWRAWVKNKIKKLITFFTCIVLLSVSICIFFTKYGVGYRYYKTNAIQIGVTQQENLVSQTINDYLDELGENGYYIYSAEMNDNIYCKKAVVKKNNINTDDIKKDIINNLKVSIFITQLSIDNDDNIYYFKSENECNDFVNELKKYNEDITTEISSEIAEMQQITDKQVLEDKIEEYRLEKERKDRIAKEKAERQRVATVSSRSGGNSISEYSGSSAHPLNSYTYMSSGFGYRWGRLHTGVDFATPTGTEVHAWKSGTIIYASWCGGYGNYVKIQHDDGTISCYGHLNSYACSVGDYVNCHEIIAYSGNTGHSTRSTFTFWN